MITPAAYVCVSTETHLAKAASRRFIFHPYQAANECTLIPDQARMRGGVEILVARKAAFKDLPAEKFSGRLVVSPLSSCSVLLYPKYDDLPCIRLTGIYCPPQAATRVAQVSRKAEPAAGLRYRDERQGRKAHRGLEPYGMGDEV